MSIVSERAQRAARRAAEKKMDEVLAVPHFGIFPPREDRQAAVRGIPDEPDHGHVDHNYSTLHGRPTEEREEVHIPPSPVRRPQSERSNVSSRAQRELQRRQVELQAKIQLARLDEEIERAKSRKKVLESQLLRDVAYIEASNDEDEVRSARLDRTEEWVRRGGEMGAPSARPLSADPDFSEPRAAATPRPCSRYVPPTHKQNGDGSCNRPREFDTQRDHLHASRYDDNRRHPEPQSHPSASEYVRQLERLVAVMSTAGRSRPAPKQTYELPTFTGNPADWLAFKRSYYNSTDMYDFKAFENMARLQASLQGDARLAVEDLLRASDDPGEIMRVLEEEFGHPTLLLECAMNKVRSLPRVTDSGREIRTFTAVVRNCVSLLKAVRADGYLNNPQIVSDILNKLTPYQRAQYGEYVMKRDSNSYVDLRVSPNLEILVDFLGQLSRASVYYAPANPPSLPVSSVPAGRGREQPRGGRLQHRVMAQAETTRHHGDERVLVRMETTAKDCKCVLCNLSHQLPQCEQFLKMTVNDRWKLVKDNKLCFKCLIKSHSRNQCKAKRCGRCRWSHHILLHEERSASGRDVPATHTDTETVTTVGGARSRALLKVLPVTIIDDNGRETSTYALLDDGATVSIVDESCAAGTSGSALPLRLLTAGGNSVEDLQSRRVQIGLRGSNGKCHTISVRTMRNIELPTHTLPAHVLEESPHLRSLDCVAMEGVRPMLLLGQDNWELIVGQEVRRGKSGKPVASLTRLGWVVHGPIGSHSGPIERVNCMQMTDSDLHNLVKHQFELEAIGVSKALRKNADTERALRILDNTATRVPGGWEVGLLWNKPVVEMPDNYRYAHRRLQGIERKMDADTEFASAYCKQVDRLLQEGYANKVEGGINASPIWYLPHFGVKNPNKPGKLRLVFDAAATFKGTCLNDNLFSGPDLLNSLLGILLRFRTGPIAFTGDIMDMFLRVKIREADRGAQLFLWRGMDRDREPEAYVMTSMIFGAASSPSSANYVLRRNADEFRDIHPEAVKAIHGKHYMDDYLDSVDTVEQAKQLIEDVSAIHRAGGFCIRGWVSNSPELRERLPAVTSEPTRIEEGKLSNNDKERTLGMIWSPRSDTLSFDMSFKRLPLDIVEGRATPTKREFLSFVMSIFDPLGLVSPCTIQSRILMQRVWKSGVGWDEQLKKAEAELWDRWLQNLHLLHEVSIPRWYRITGDPVELHVFADASEQAYAAVAYIVGEGADGPRTVAIVAGKARVAPIKIVSIPRLELQAAVLAWRLAGSIQDELGKSVSQTVLWSDSRTVLAWIANENRDYPKFIAHRLAELDSVARGSWRWVPSLCNPADKATKLAWPEGGSDWVGGPPFLRCSQELWPRAESMQPLEASESEPAYIHAAAEQQSPLIVLTRYSTWTRAVRVMARVIVFIRVCQGRPTATINPEDLRDAELHLLVQVQSESFAAELRALRAGDALLPSSRLRALEPMLYEDGLLRVRGRLSAATTLSFDEKHPVILDGRHYAARLLVRAYHERTLHANHEAVLNHLRERFWILRARSTVRAVVARCQLCRLRRARPVPPKMGDLPLDRVMDTRRAFVNCGLDYFGPMEVAIGRRREKRWGVLFTCLATRAVHLDLAASLSADSAILALRRFIARRGRPARIRSDRGTNFVGAERELHVALQRMDHDLIQEEAVKRRIEWVFNPPAAPHMGGSWERLVRAVKGALRTTLRERAPKEEVLQTLLAEVELVVNSRPLAYVACDPDEPVMITPNHLLLGTAAGDTPMTTINPVDINARAQWRRVNALAEAFWRRWLKLYVPTLQQRQKWTVNNPPVRIGDVVVICDANSPRNVWPKGIVQKVFPGSDGVVRVVEIRTVTGVLRRPVVKVIVLPTDSVLLS